MALDADDEAYQVQGILKGLLGLWGLRARAVGAGLWEVWGKCELCGLGFGGRAGAGLRRVWACCASCVDCVTCP
jgi:hypothetical protein